MAFLTFAGSDREESVNWLAASLVSTAVSELGHAVESQRLETLNLPYTARSQSNRLVIRPAFAILDPRFRKLTDSSSVAPNSTALSRLSYSTH